MTTKQEAMGLGVDATPEGSDRRSTEKWIDEVVGVFKDPIITYSGPWGNDIPDWLREAITMDRLIGNMKALHGEPMMAGDAEVAAYLMTASLEAPMGHDFTQIYLYCATRTIERYKKGAMPEDVRVDKLGPDEERELRDLKIWIYETRLKHRKGQLRDDRRALRESVSGEGPGHAWARHRAKAVGPIPKEAAGKPVLQPGLDFGL
jgi:hypothetical protein